MILRHLPRGAAFAAAGLLLSCAASAAPPPNARGALGRIDFAVTGSAECRRLFTRGMLEMHSFQYDQAHASFGAALARDPACAMAAWGDAMAYEHPIWLQRDVQKSRGAMARIVREDRLTAKERAYLATARTLFAIDERKAALQSWLAAAAKMHAQYPVDDEVALQHALARIAVYDELNDPREMVKAGAIALEVLRRRPDHPGAAHYVIHAFDTNDHAILALPAARSYSRIAPASAHALHMPSHTFTQLGMWAEVVPLNVRAFAASKAAARRLGQTSASWDWHAYAWLAAAHLELGQARSARRLLDDVRELLAREDSPYLRNGYSNVLTNYLTQTGRWTEAEELAAPLLALVRGEASDGNAVACAEHAPGGSGEQRAPYVLMGRVAAHRIRAEAALALGDVPASQARAKDIIKVREQMDPWDPRRPAVTLAYAAEVEARARLAGERSPEREKEVLDLLEQSAQVYDGTLVSGPAFYTTPRERLAGALLAAGRPAEAFVQYERVLKTRPNRAMSLLGAARSARAAGNADKAREHYAALAALWKDADEDFPGLTEARAGGGSSR